MDEIKTKPTPEDLPKFSLIIKRGSENGTGSADLTLYTYDHYNRLTGYKKDHTSASYQYNAQGYRVQKTVNGSTTNYLYETDKVVLETNGSNEQKAVQVYGSALLYRSVAGSKTESYYYLYNAHGDVTALIDANGNLAATYDYDAFGNMISETGSADNYIKYAGYQKDDENGLYYLNARYYDSVIARFITEDTYTGQKNDPLSLNLYTYCANNPIMYTDPSGHKSETLKKGDSGVEVRTVQELLCMNGYNVKVDGKFGPETQAAIKKFQDASNNLKVDGIVGTKTLSALHNSFDSIMNEMKVKSKASSSSGSNNSSNKSSTVVINEQSAPTTATQNQPVLNDSSKKQTAGDYFLSSGKQVILGNFTDDVTLLGTAAQIATGFAGVDLPGDVRDLSADIINWEWSWSHAGQTALDVAAFLPVVGILKYTDEAGTLIKHADEAGSAIKGASKALTSADDVAGYVQKNGKLPENFITKDQAKAAGWDPKQGNLSDVAPGKSIGGDIFKNKGNVLPDAPGRTWYEADVNYSGGYRSTDRIIYSNDGLIYQTSDHYKTFTQIK